VSLPQIWIDNALLNRYLLGQINRHKNIQVPESQSSYSPAVRANTYSSKSSTPRLQPPCPYESEDYSQQPIGRSTRGGHAARGYRGAKAVAPHRNRTLVLNGSTPNLSNQDKSSNISANENTAPGLSNNNPSWVTKKDRHFQLINTSVYAKESQSRTKAIEETRKQKAIERDARERTKFNRHIQRVAAQSALPDSSHKSSSYELTVQGVKFLVEKDGSKLVKVSGEKRPLQTATIMAHHNNTDTEDSHR
jgi:hypothetical protein